MERDLALQCAGGTFNYRVTDVVIERGAVLIQKRRGDDVWALPGGCCAFWETSRQALRREFREELGVGAEVSELLWVVENFCKLGAPCHELLFCYGVRLQGILPVATLDEAGERGDLDFRWLPVRELRSVRLRPAFLQEALRHLPETVGHLVCGTAG